MYAGRLDRNQACFFFPYHDNDQTATGGFFHEAAETAGLYD